MQIINVERHLKSENATGRPTRRETDKVGDEEWKLMEHRTNPKLIIMRTNDGIYTTDIVKLLIAIEKILV